MTILAQSDFAVRLQKGDPLPSALELTKCDSSDLVENSHLWMPSAKQHVAAFTRFSHMNGPRA
jgi:hypothetical protein